MIEHKKRSIAKAISCEKLGAIDTVLINFLVTRGSLNAVSIVSFEFITKTLLYYFYKKTWSKICFGRQKIEPEYQI
ncbi:MAG: DUF2061 domain-containing protein [Sulfurospirillum sp.]|nr:DUF2061 domain-containing protein [Sulfurospirillum sp.]